MDRGGCLWRVPGLQLDAAQVVGHSSPQASQPRCQHEDGSFLQLTQPQPAQRHSRRQLADGAIFLVCVLGAFSDLGS